MLNYGKIWDSLRCNNPWLKIQVQESNTFQKSETEAEKTKPKCHKSSHLTGKFNFNWQVEVIVCNQWTLEMFTVWIIWYPIENVMLKFVPKVPLWMVSPSLQTCPKWPSPKKNKSETSKTYLARFWDYSKVAKTHIFLGTIHKVPNGLSIGVSDHFHSNKATRPLQQKNKYSNTCVHVVVKDDLFLTLGTFPLCILQPAQLNLVDVMMIWKAIVASLTWKVLKPWSTSGDLVLACHFWMLWIDNIFSNIAAILSPNLK